MNIASRTPEGLPARCPVCGANVVMEPCAPLGDAPCPACGNLLFFEVQGGTVSPYGGERRQSKQRALRRLAEQLGVDEIQEHEVFDLLPELDLDSIDIVELVMLLEDESEPADEEYDPASEGVDLPDHVYFQLITNRLQRAKLESALARHMTTKIMATIARWLRLATIALLIPYWCFMVWETHSPIPWEPGPSVPHGDKLFHFAGFFGLGGLLSLAMTRPGGFLAGSVKGVKRAWLVGAAYAALDEITQPLSGRTADAFDWACDVIGLSIGCAVAVAVIRSFARTYRATDDRRGGEHA